MRSLPARPSKQRFAVALAVWVVWAGASVLRGEEGVIDLGALPNYVKQVVPSYIFTDNTPWGPEPYAFFNPMTNTGATLGRLLFYDKRLSRNDTVSCSSCHQQAHAFTTPDIAGTGVGGTTKRHPMRLVNLRFRSEPTYFFDSRERTLESVVTQPIRSPIELGFSGTNGEPDFAALIAKLSALPEYEPLFRIAFGSPGIDELRIQKALSQFIRSIQSFDSKYDAGLAVAHGGPFPNFTDSESRGKQLFLGLSAAPVRGANCSLCHEPQTFFNSKSVTTGNNGVIGAIGGGTDLTVVNSPTLRDMVNPSGQLNGPLMHNGSFTSFAQVLDHYNAPPANPKLAWDLLAWPKNGVPEVLNLTAQERLDLEAFLRTLSGQNLYTDPKWSNPFRPDGTITVTDSAPQASQTVNLSTRMQVLTAEKVGIGGFIITGTAPKRVLVRALGPSLAKFGLSTLLGDPTITLNGPAGFAPILNDNWRSLQENEIKATGLAPGNDLEPAIIATLNPGAYTAILSGTDGGTGTGILEIYDLNPAADSKLANLSTRAFVGTGDNILIAGFTVGNADSVDHIVVRGLGLTVQVAGVRPALLDPTLEVRDANGVILATNDNYWSGDPGSRDIRVAGLGPQYDGECALALAVGPGAYTALLSPSTGRSINPPGVALVEIYSLGRVP
jgi:cytochrome c peroxidase